MKITSVIPKPPREVTMTFTQHEGRALVMALNDAVFKYQQAVDREQWRQWANDLDAELRR